MRKSDPKKIHFLGIGGSGASAAAILAKKSGYKVTGCNKNLNTPYLDKVKDYKIKLFEGHSKEHLNDADLLAVSPALFYSERDIDEIEYAKKTKSLSSWQSFVGDYLLKDHQVISVAGTHGKSTTTAMLGLMMEGSHLDPKVIIGAKVSEWDGNFRWGESEYFVIESDEFYDNYLNYNPDYIILNNIEYDHPDYFDDVKMLHKSFSKFIRQLKGEKTLIVNVESEGVRSVLNSLPKSFKKRIKIIGYSTKKRKISYLDQLYLIKDIKKTKGLPSFKLHAPNQIKLKIKLSVPGLHNVFNSTGALILMDHLTDNLDDAVKALEKYKGIGRRLELILDKKKVKVFDDYAHHPTAIKKTLQALRDRNKDSLLIAIIEPHSFSRTKKLLTQYKDVFKSADHVVVGPIFKARDKEDFGISGEDITSVAEHDSITYKKRLNEIISYLENLKSEDNLVIVVMGAGDSYKWARNIAEFL